MDRIAHAVMLAVGHHSHDLNLRIVLAARVMQGKVGADRVLMWEVALDQFLIDDSYLGTAAFVGFAEFASCEERDLHRREIARTDPVLLYVGILVLVRDISNNID